MVSAREQEVDTKIRLTLTLRFRFAAPAVGALPCVGVGSLSVS